MSTKTYVYLVLFLSLLIGISAYGEWRARELARSVERYEACVLEETGMTAAAFYQLHGYYPECVPSTTI